MQNHEETIITYIENCDHTDDVKAIFIGLLLDLLRYCHADRDYQSPKTLKQLFPKETWEDIDGHDRNTLGRHVSHLVKLGGLPLTIFDKTSKNHWRYVINK
jgi:hypothetical protein